MPSPKFSCSCLAFTAFLGSALTLVGLFGAFPSRLHADEVGRIAVTDESGRTLNLDFETGDLRGWIARGDAFAGQPVEGDTIATRRGDMTSGHQGRFWIGSFERGGDAPQGTLRSPAFPVTQPFASFLVSGGSESTTCVELMSQDTQQVLFQATGRNHETLRRVAVDLTPYQGQFIYLRLVDQASGGWGHINFDDFVFHPSRPELPLLGRPQDIDEYQHAGLGPEAAARAMTVPEGFEVSLFAGEPDVVQPIAQAIDDRGRLWVAEAYSYPIRLPQRQARDRILIFEDRDGDGRFDERKVFAERLNLVSGLEVGFGGVWVGAAPHLLFIPDADGDDRPDGPPQIMLDGWGFQDTHETLNAFTWGPDGWLYGCHGVFTHSNVGQPGTPEDQRVALNAAVWRYHPLRHEFEVFAHGTSNPWGVDFDDHGQCFITACVIPHLYHMIQGGRYERQAGQHFNPYTFDDIKTIADHRHWVGATPHSGNNRSDSAGGGHAHAGAMIYLGGAWPERYRNQIFMNNIHGARLNVDILEPEGSGYVGHHGDDFLLANDAWSQIVNLQYGPDGQMYMIDWYDQNQCHRRDPAVHDRTNGRIFKVSYAGADAAPIAGPQARLDLAALDSAALVKLLLHKNEWYVRHARRLLQERGSDPAVQAALVQLAFESPELPTPRRLRALWALHASQGLGENHVRRGLADADPWLRAWTVQLALERQAASPATLGRLAELAQTDASPVVRKYVAAGLQRLEPEARWDALAALLASSADESDHNLPLLSWYALEPLAEVDLDRFVRLGTSSTMAPIVGYTARRALATGGSQAVALIVDVLGAQTVPARQQVLLAALRQGLAGQRQAQMPPAWPAVAQALFGSDDAQLRADALALSTTFGDPAALAQLERVLSDRGAEPSWRRQALAALLQARTSGLDETLLTLVDDPQIRGDVVRALAAYGDERVPGALLDAYPTLLAAERRDALATLASREPFAVALLDAVAAGHVPSADLTADLIRQLRNLGSSAVERRIGEVWGTVQDTPADRLRQIEAYRQLLTATPAETPDLPLGRATFAKVCQQCHTLFATGGKVGPELTGSNRANLDYLLANVVDPSALIGKDYQATIIVTVDGRVLTGLIQAEDGNAVTLATANETVVLPKNEIDQRMPSPKSMMPDDLLQPLSPHEIRSLVAYLASPRQVPLLATVDSARTFFNGQDLAGWTASGPGWSVAQGELRAQPADSQPLLLTSDLWARDFTLSGQVWLPEGATLALSFRAQAATPTELLGPRVELTSGRGARLAEIGGRGELARGAAEARLAAGDWTRFAIRGRGTNLSLEIDGRPALELTDAEGPEAGVFGLAVSAQPGSAPIRLRNLVLEVPSPAVAATASTASGE